MEMIMKVVWKDCKTSASIVHALRRNAVLNAKVLVLEGHWYDTPGKAKNASMEQPEIPAFVTLSGLETEYMDYMRPTRTRNNTKSAAQQNDDAIYNYLITQQFNRKDSVGLRTT